jgi:RimJ/RimL family protein N-acetyltransferase
VSDEFEWPEQQPILGDGRLTLRPWTAGDVDCVFRACQDPDIQRYTTVPVPYLREHAEQFVSLSAPTSYQQRVAAGFAVTDAASGEVLGACGLAAVDVVNRTSGAGYWIAPWGRGRRVASGSLSVLTTWALTPGRLRRIQMEIEPENAASVAAAMRAGYVRLDLPPLMEMHRGEVRPFDLYEKTAKG